LSSAGSAHYFTSDARNRPSAYTILDISDSWTPSSGSSNVIGLKIAPFAHPTGTSTGRLYGVYIAPSGVTNLTKYTSMYISTPSDFCDNWGIYQSAERLRNWFGGKVGIGSGKSSPVYGLDINSRVAINTDSLPTATNVDSVVMIGSTGQLKKRPFSAFGGGSSYTFSTGLTNSASTITNDISTGVSGGQTIIGSTSTNSGLTYKATTGVGTTGADHIFQVGNNGATEAMRILNSGNIGIGTSSASRLLTVLGGFTVSSAGVVSWGASEIGSLTYDAGRAIVRSMSGDLTFGANTAYDQLTVKSGGNVVIGSTTSQASAILEAVSTTKGFLPPRMTTTQMNAISSPAEGLTVYDLTVHKMYTYDGTTWQAHW
jgi:hypothetical protein